MNPRYKILFDQVKIGPKVTKNRFYQVPHCTGTGTQRPKSVAYLRWVKAQGGWGVVNTELCSIHATSDCEPLCYASLWNERDVDAFRLQTDLLHQEGALAGVELQHGGAQHLNLMSRKPPFSPAVSRFTGMDYPLQSAVMDRGDIRNVVRWHADAARRAVRAGFDIVYVYAGHGMLPLQFLQTRYNHRTDEYGGSLRNRTRLLHELFAATRDAVGDSAAVALRIAVDELDPTSNIRHDGEVRDIISDLAGLPDLWDVCLMSWKNDSQTSRFTKNEGYQEPYVRHVKRLVGDVPVVGTGRFTSPDMMVEQIRSGTLDLVGAARPSIADPYIPNKIAEGRESDIRECIGCNICASADNEGVPIRCTQNPTMGEEWRRGWHPEIVPPQGSRDSYLVVGGGPAGLECALTLARRGYQVSLAETSAQLGGRVLSESTLRPLSVWRRVATWRQSQLAKLPNVNLYRASTVTADDVLAFGADRVVLATGARWRRDFVGRANVEAPAEPSTVARNLLTPDDLFADAELLARLRDVVIVDDDYYYLASVFAEVLAQQGARVHLVTSASRVSPWSENTLEQEKIHARLLELGVTLHLSCDAFGWTGAALRLRCSYTGAERAPIAAEHALLVTARVGERTIYDQLQQRLPHLRSVGFGVLSSGADDAAAAAAAAAAAPGALKSVHLIGDAYAPSTIQAAVYHGHETARAADDTAARESYVRVERVVVGHERPRAFGLEHSV